MKLLPILSILLFFLSMSKFVHCKVPKKDLKTIKGKDKWTQIFLQVLMYFMENTIMWKLVSTTMSKVL